MVFEVAFCHVTPSFSEELFLSLGRRRLGNGYDCMVGVGRDDLFLLPHNGLWVLAVLHGSDATPDDTPQHEDATIGGGQMFQAVSRQPPVDASLRVVVPWHSLPLLIWPICRLAKSRTPRLLLPLSQAHEAHEHGVVVVHRHRKMRMTGSIHVHLTGTRAP